jgi:hypothetical protein
MFDPENPVPFAGFVEANSQHIGGIGVLQGTAPNDLHHQCVVARGVAPVFGM